jgi:hypothetical protein
MVDNKSHDREDDCAVIAYRVTFIKESFVLTEIRRRLGLKTAFKMIRRVRCAR